MNKEKPSWDDVKFRILFPFEQVLINSLEIHSNSISRWMRPSVWFGCLRESVSERYSHDILKDCLTYWKLLEWQRAILWIHLAAYSGAYESIGRELRFIVEDMGQAIAIDKKFPNMSLENKVHEVSRKFRGQSLFVNFKITEEMKTDLRAKWEILCGYAHPSKEVVKTSVAEVKYVFTLIEKQFNELLEIFTETIDLVLAALLGHFAKAIEDFIEYDSRFVDPPKYELYHYGYWNALSICNKECPKSFNEPFFGHYDDERNEKHSQRRG
ncbi:MAG: hypothetical protein ACTSWA_01685 [Candidatus Thorarchaeota archaeon]